MYHFKAIPHSPIKNVCVFFLPQLWKFSETEKLLVCVGLQKDRQATVQYPMQHIKDAASDFSVNVAGHLSYKMNMN